jgi:glycosyltransferase involved in cell wall biosynthesis
MRVAIDYTSAVTEQAGIGRYTRGLARALARSVPEDISLTLWSGESRPKDHMPPPGGRARLLTFGVGHRILTRLWHTLHIPLPAELLMGWPELIHGPDFVLPPALFARRIVTIHDLAYLTFPDCAQPGIVEYLSAEVPRALRAADHIIAVSRRTSLDLVELLRVAPRRVSVIYPGVDPMFTPEADPRAVSEILRRYDLAQPLILAVGTLEPRKNYERLIEAFAAAAEESGGPRQLVFAGKQGWRYEGIFAAARREARRAERIRFLGYVEDSELPALYHSAAALAMPSLFEGFGLPVIEAMASGTPVVCSTGGALPEIAGSAALIVAPEDVAGLRDALVSACRDQALRARLTGEGISHARLFSWETAAQQHFQLYQEIGGNGNRRA